MAVIAFVKSHLSTSTGFARRGSLRLYSMCDALQPAMTIFLMLSRWAESPENSICNILS